MKSAVKLAAFGERVGQFLWFSALLCKAMMWLYWPLSLRPAAVQKAGVEAY
jgi:hypothetical protein